MRSSRHLVAGLSAAAMAAAPVAVAAQSANPVPQTSIYFSSERAAPDAISMPGQCRVAAGATAGSIPIIGFLVNFLFEEILEAVNRARLARIESLTDSYGALRNFARLPDHDQIAEVPGHGAQLAAEDATECLVVVQRADLPVDSAVTQYFIFGLHRAGTSGLVIEPLATRINATEANDRAGRDQRVTSRISIALSALPAGACDAAGVCKLPALTVLGDPAFTFRRLSEQTDYGCSANHDGPGGNGCGVLGGPAAMIPLPRNGTPVTIGVTVSNASVTIRDAELSQQIWQRQRGALLDALNGTVEALIGD